ncbi:hypothetical protein LZZ85_05630 [Terrimonas sp. NA20]|uniref:SGNH hydrolase-type esterase domain-containing protein n=1 Tax=Terrimonas ginsenosidimutans TaxID=2908004 RepID=A0ABS9KN52_9BACT|nr:hypothetical protein [Terrimonas ginsenosidimutans]MCG2613748.1 hypothetical protein [Terrimonas ginsenosidimutans]
MKKNLFIFLLFTSFEAFTQTPKLLGEAGRRTDITSLTFLENRNALVGYSAALRRLSLDSISSLGVASYGNSVSGNYAVSFNEVMRTMFDFRMLTYPSSFNGGVADFHFNGKARYADSAVIQSRLAGSPGVDFTYIASGDHFILDANDSIGGSTGQQRGYDVFKAIFAKTPTGGNVIVKVFDLLADTLIRSQSINLYSDTIAPAKIEFSGLPDFLRLRFSVVCTSGEAVGIKLAFITAKGLTPLQLGRGGSTLSQNLYANRSILKFLLDEFNIKLIMVSAKEENATLSLPALADTLKQFPLISKLIIGSAPDAGSTANQLANNKLFREMALKNDFAYCDAYTLFGGYSYLSALGLQGDGTHPRAIVNDIVAREVITTMGWSIYGSRLRLNIDNTDEIVSRHVKTSQLYIQTHGSGSFEQRKRLFATSSGGGAPMKINLFNINHLYFDSLNTGVGIGAYGTQGVAVLDNKLMRAGRFVVSDESLVSFFGGVNIGRSMVVNYNSGDYNLNVKGTTDGQLLFAKASTNSVGIGTQFPSEKLHVNGNFISQAPAYTSGGYSRLVRHNSSGRYETLPETIYSGTVTTSNATAVNFSVATGSEEVGTIEVTLSGKEQGAGGGGITGKKIVRYKNVSGSVSLGAVTSILPDEEDMTGTPVWTITSTGTNIQIRVTGVAATNIVWNFQYQINRSVYTP